MAEKHRVLRLLEERVPAVQHLKEWSKDVVLPGFDGVSLYTVLSFFMYEVKRDLLVTRAKAIAFTFFLALFPSILFFVSLIPFFPIDNIQGHLLEVAQEIIPASMSDLMNKVITDIAKPRGGTLSLGLFLALFISSNGMMGMMDSFDQSIRTRDSFVPRPLWKRRGIAMTLTLVLFALMVFSVALIIMGNQALIVMLEQFHILSMFNVILFTTLKYLIIFFMFFTAISIIYHYGPSVNRKWDYISPGSTFATMLSIILSIGFSFFINNISSPGRFFGSIGTIIVLQVWIYLNSLALLIGFELNASIDECRRRPDGGHCEELPKPDEELPA